MDPIIAQLEEQCGIHFMGVDAQMQLRNLNTRNFDLAQDAQPALVTNSNSGIPAWLTTFVDPKMIETLVTPMKAAEILRGEVKKGDWVTDTAMFPVVESTGFTSTYGDWNNNGHAGVNVNWPERQSYHYQTITEYGEREQARAGLAKLDLANRKNIAAVLTLNKYQNKTYFYGVSGLRNYGLLNDPTLSPPIAPLSVGGSTTWASKDANAILADVTALYAQLQVQAPGLVELDTPMTLAMSPLAEAQLTKTTNFNVNVEDFLKKNYSNLKVVTAPEYNTPAGQMVQLIVNELEGQKTAEPAFTEKLRQHPVKTDLSSFAQKKSQGTWGTIIYRPFLIAAMLGV